MQVEVAEHTQFEGRVGRPVGVGFTDCDDVDCVQEEFHAEKGKQEADGVEGGSAGCDAGEGVGRLGDVVVEGEDWAGEVQGWVEDVGEICAERGEVGCWGGNGYAIAFREGGGV